MEVFVNQLRQRKLQKSCEEISKPPRELWVELRAEVSQQFGQTGEIYIGTQPFSIDMIYFICCFVQIVSLNKILNTYFYANSVGL